MICNNCGGQLCDDDKFCPHCGSEVKKRVIYCTNCGKPLDPCADFCLNCGVRVKNKEWVSKNVGFLEAYKLYWKHGLDFKGRANLTEFWFVEAWNFILSFLIGAVILVFFTGTALSASERGEFWTAAGVWFIIILLLVLIWAIVNLIPSISLGVRRLHDSGKSGLLLLLGLIPSVGTLAVLIFMCLPSDPHENSYG